MIGSREATWIEYDWVQSGVRGWIWFELLEFDVYVDQMYDTNESDKEAANY